MHRSFCLISPAINILEGYDIIHLNGDIHRYVLSTSSFLCDIGEPRYKQNKMGYQISRIRNTVLLRCWQKKRLARKGYYWSQNILFYVIFFFCCLKMIFCEQMLLELGDLLGLSLLRNFFSAARSIFSCKYFSKMAQYFNFSNLIPNFVLLIFRHRKLLVLKTKLWMSPFKWNIEEKSQKDIVVTASKPSKPLLT